ncbi:hypothetical protein ABZ400_02855 [Streptomyces sp. NPDC005897]|uniref:hypothetical protein n=1 Tax=Streptomyces sp. NPDC005897 TaxID=3157081 RepID=UPI00340D094F
MLFALAVAVALLIPMERTGTDDATADKKPAEQAPTRAEPVPEQDPSWPARPRPDTTIG